MLRNAHRKLWAWFEELISLRQNRTLPLWPLCIFTTKLFIWQFKIEHSQYVVQKWHDYGRSFDRNTQGDKLLAEPLGTEREKSNMCCLGHDFYEECRQQENRKVASMQHVAAHIRLHFYWLGRKLKAWSWEFPVFFNRDCIHLTLYLKKNM